MRFLITSLVILSSIGVSSTTAGPLGGLFHHSTQVITNTDVLPSERAIPTPTPERPVYYIAVSAGYRDIGPSLAGATPPSKDGVIDAMTKILDRQGYKLSTNKDPAQLVIVYSWGRLNTDKWDFGGTLSTTRVAMNRGQILEFLGALKPSVSTTPGVIDRSFFGPDAIVVDPDNEQFQQISDMPFYTVSLAAYDLESAKTTKPAMLWRTRIACPSVGHSLPEVLPTMLTIAAPFIGRQTSRPIWVNASDRFKPHVEIGEAKVAE